MSHRRLRKNVVKCSKLNNPEVLSWTAVIITDSKGRYLHQVGDPADKTESKILWLGRSGFSSTNAVDFLSCKKIHSLLKFHKHIRLYVWVGTCDLTSKGKRFIQLKKPTDKSVKIFCNNLKAIKERCKSTCSRIKLTFLHVPYYLIQLWNEKKGHKNRETFKDDDRKLSCLIDTVNKYIDSLNEELGSYSPKLNQDLLRSRKKKKHQARYSTNYKLLLDGIHPDRRLAASWFSSIRKQIRRDCV